MTYGRALDTSRYGEITPLKVFNSGKQTRLYVQLGRRDGFNPREIAEYFSGLLNIPQRMVDRIDVAENFSLVSLPAQAAADAIERSRRDTTMPHMHVDSRDAAGTGGRRSGPVGRPRTFGEGGGSGRYGSPMRSGGSSRSGTAGHAGDFAGSFGSRRRNRDSGFAGSGNSSRASVPQRPASSRTANAGLYKRRKAAD